MPRKLFKWTTLLSILVIAAGVVALVYAFASDSHYDPNAVITDSNGFTSRGAYVSNSAWGWVGGILLGVGVTAFFVGLFGWIVSAVMAGGRKVLADPSGSLGGLLGSSGSSPTPRI